MAGILITVGKDIQETHEKAKNYFIEFKRLEIAHEDKGVGFSLSKFTRSGSDDMNYSSNENNSVWVVGTLIYKNKIGQAAREKLLLDLYRDSFDALVDHCDGPFCLVLKNHAEQTLLVVTDHSGIINMYSYQSGSTFMLSSSSLSLSRNHPVTPDHNAIAQFLRTGNVYGSDTIYREIQVLEPASIYKIEEKFEGHLSLTKQYWKSPIEINEGSSLEKSRDVLISALLNSFEVFSKESLICDFTAGFDSRLNMAVLSQFKPFSDIHSFVFGPDGSREVELVKGYCKTLGAQCHHFRLPDDWDERIFEYVQKAMPITDGEENIFAYAPILYAQENKAHDFQYSINGLGGELYRDFWWIQEILCSKRPANIDRLIHTRILQYEYDYSIFSDTWNTKIGDVKNTLKAAFEKTLSDMNLHKSYNNLQIDNLYFRQKIRRWAGRTMSSSNHFIHTIAPLTLKKNLEVALTIPARYKRNGRLVKSIIEQLSFPLAELEMLNGTPCQNFRIGNMHKFIPLALDYGKRGVRKIIQKTTNRTILVDRSINYQPSLFFSYLFGNKDFAQAFRYDSLITAGMYDRDKYMRFYQRAISGDFPYYNQLGNILTLEMRIRQDKIRDNNI